MSPQAGRCLIPARPVQVSGDQVLQQLDSWTGGSSVDERVAFVDRVGELNRLVVDSGDRGMAYLGQRWRIWREVGRHLVTHAGPFPRVAAARNGENRYHARTGLDPPEPNHGLAFTQALPPGKNGVENRSLDHRPMVADWGSGRADSASRLCRDIEHAQRAETDDRLRRTDYWACINRGGRIRTGDPLLPKQVRYRTAPRPNVRRARTARVLESSPPASLLAASATARPGPQPDHHSDSSYSKNF